MNIKNRIKSVRTEVMVSLHHALKWDSLLFMAVVFFALSFIPAVKEDSLELLNMIITFFILYVIVFTLTLVKQLVVEQWKKRKPKAII